MAPFSFLASQTLPLSDPRGLVAALRETNVLIKKTFLQIDRFGGVWSAGNRSTLRAWLTSKVRFGAFDNGQQLGTIKPNVKRRNALARFFGKANITNKYKGGDDADEIYGANLKDWLYGGEGNDAIIGRVGDDSLHGEGGRDQLEGN